jgi:hypothetical protein
METGGRSGVAVWLMALSLAMGACSPTVRLEAPKEPIQINMNVKIEQEVRVRVERDLEDEFAANPALFGVPAASLSPLAKTPSEKGRE